MDIVQLRYFKTVAETGHLTNAAKKMNVAQPALSVSISRLESEVGAPLFDRVGRGIYLNNCGEIYLQYVEQVLALIDKSHEEINQYCDKLENVLNIGIVSKPFPQMVIASFKEKYPSCKIRQITISMDDVEEELKKNDVDIVISTLLSEDERIVGEMISEEDLLLAVHKNNPLAKRKRIKLIEAKDEPFISLPNGYEYRTVTDAVCAKSGFTPNVARECFHCHIAELIASGEGVALISASRAKAVKNNNQIVFIKLEDEDVSIKHYMSWKATHHFNKITKEFKKYIKNYFLDENFTDCSTGCI